MRFLRTMARLLLLASAACRAPEREALSTWGTMREVLREGRAEGRVALADAVGPDSVGVGALAGLAGEIAVSSGRAWVSTARGAGTATLRAAEPGDQAALLVLADVPRWEPHALGPCASVHDLEARVAEHLSRRGHPLERGIAVRVEGRGRAGVHVIAGACPIARPDGPPPWRGAAEGELVLVGVFADDAAGRLTHHGRRTHLHAIARDVMGHLDDLVLEDATLYLPARERPVDLERDARVSTPRPAGAGL